MSKETGAVRVHGSTPDSVGIAPLISAQLEHLCIVPPKLVYDQAGGTAKIIADVDKASNGETQLVVHLVDYNPQRTRFSAQNFTLEEAGLTCPNGQTGTRFYRSGSADGWNYRFLPEQCAGCPLWEQCRDPKAKPDVSLRYGAALLLDPGRIVGSRLVYQDRCLCVAASRR